MYAQCVSKFPAEIYNKTKCNNTLLRKITPNFSVRQICGSEK